MPWTQVCYQYDGSFAGFLTCVFQSYVNREEPAQFLTPEEGCCSLYPVRGVTSDDGAARRVYLSLRPKLGGVGADLVTRGFLTCLEEKELWLWRLICQGYERGASVSRDFSDPVVDVVRRAVTHLGGEVQLLKGFVRFSELDGVLAGEITPKNRVLPLLRGHFCARYPQECFVLYDKTHREALFHKPGQSAIVLVDDFQMGAAGEEERAYRAMWRAFYDAISIEGRYNPKCRRTHMPMRYWENMTEFQSDGPAGLGGGVCPAMPEGR